MKCGSMRNSEDESDDRADNVECVKDLQMLIVFQLGETRPVSKARDEAAVSSWAGFCASRNKEAYVKTSS